MNHVMQISYSLQARRISEDTLHTWRMIYLFQEKRFAILKTPQRRDPRPNVKYNIDTNNFAREDLESPMLDALKGLLITF